MILKKTLVCGAVLMAFTSLSMAQSLAEQIPEKFDKEVYRTAYPDEPASSGETTWKGVGKVASSEQITAGHHTPAFLSTNDAKTVTNEGKIWVLADKIEGNQYGDRAMGISASGGNTGINSESGVIYVYSDNRGSLNFERAKGMDATKNESGADPTSITNFGNIYVEGGTGMLVTGSTNVDATTAEVSNQGTITVVNSGYGMSLGGNNAGDVSMTNSGTIYASGAYAVGITQSDAFNGEVTNTGKIYASDGAIAIAAGNSEDSQFQLNLKKGSHIEGDILLNANSNVSISELNNEELTLRGAVKDIAVSKSAVVIKKSDSTETLSINSIDVDSETSTTFEFDSLGSADKLLNITSVTGEGEVKVNYTSEVSDALANNQTTVEDLLSRVSVGNDNSDLDALVLDQGKWGDGMVFDKDGNLLSRTTNSLLSSTTDLALMNGLVWRSQLTNLSDRMGTLRTMPQAAGAWARYNNGRLDGRGIQYDYNTIEVGFDAPVSSNFLVGVALDYTIGETDLNAGSADNDTYTLGLYGTYFGDNGGFVDLMAKIGRIDNEYDISNNSGVENGDYMMTGAIVGVEAGHRFDLAYNTFVEPQVQLSYSWLRASDYSTNIRSVDFETVESLVARVGVMGGIKFAENRGAAYLKASYNHDFLGDVDAEYTALDGQMHTPFKISDELDDNWAEVSLGLNYSVTDQFNTFLDVGTGFGGDIDQKWRVNVGARYTF